MATPTDSNYFVSARGTNEKGIRESTRSYRAVEPHIAQFWSIPSSTSNPSAKTKHTPMIPGVSSNLSSGSSHSSGSVSSGSVTKNALSSPARQQLRPKMGVRVALIFAVVMTVPLLNCIYQSHNCTVYQLHQLHHGLTIDRPDISLFKPRGFPYEESDSPGDEPSVDELPPLQQSAEEDAISSNNIETNRRIQQVNATIVTSPTKITEKRKKYYQYECALQTPPKHAKTLARVILFQRDGRNQLRDFVTHYTKALPYNSLVIMDHEGSDDYTQSLLKDYGAMGAHIWRCKGSFKAKAIMWTQVTRVYAPDSGFVFPVDVDELLAVQSEQQQQQVVGLEWSTESLKGALAKLSRSGKPYKMNWIESVPSECHVHMPHTQVQLRKAAEDEGIYASDMCDIQFVKTKEVGCMDKTFARGIQFFKTDTGNHYGGTRKHPMLSKALCDEKGLTNVYEMSTLALIHLKEKTFEDWLVHGLRGATDRGFHQIFDIDCNEVEQSLHYCKKWEKITKAKFSPYELRKVYVEDVCPQPEDELMPVLETFCRQT
jgi:Glycosyl transferase family 2